jgi:thymidylate kinase
LNGGFHEKVRRAYLKLARENKGRRWVIINAQQSFEKVEEAIWRAVSKKLGL